jgi:hypothetical protein
MRTLFVIVLFVLGAAGPLLVFACVPNPSIDGRRVRPIGAPDAPASCELLCERIGKLCGFPPLDCVATCEDEYDPMHRSCLGEAASCQEALEVCANEEVDAEADAAEDAELDVSMPEDDAGADADAASDVGTNG